MYDVLFCCSIYFGIEALYGFLARLLGFDFLQLFFIGVLVGKIP